jgi:thioredoxin-related protein
MKKCIFLFTLITIAIVGFCQKDSIQAPYQKFPVFPSVKLALPGNIIFTKKNLPKKKPVLLIVFSPMCEHCQHETEQIINNIDKFNKSEIVMATMMPYDSMMAFREKNHLARYENILVGQDTQFFLPTFFMIRNLPFLAFYDKKGKLISVFEGSMPIDKVVAELEKSANPE